MAKRKRLTPALLGGSEQALTGGADPVRDRPPIARVAGETASEAAFDETYAGFKRLLLGAWRRDELAASRAAE